MREVLGFGVLKQVALGASLYALEDVLVFLVARKDDHRGLRQEVLDLARGADAVHLGHRDVHQNHVGLLLAAERDGLLAVVGHADHLYAGQHPHEAGEAPRKEPLIVHDRHANRVLFACAQEPRTPFKATAAPTIPAGGAPSAIGRSHEHPTRNDLPHGRCFIGIFDQRPIGNSGQVIRPARWAFRGERAPDAVPTRRRLYADTAASACSPGATLATSSQLSPASAPRSIVPSPSPAYKTPGVSGPGQSA